VLVQRGWERGGLKRKETLLPEAARREEMHGTLGGQSPKGVTDNNRGLLSLSNGGELYKREEMLHQRTNSARSKRS